MKCNGEESFCWVRMWDEKTTMRINSLVDFLLDRPTDILEPRCFLPRNPWIGRPKNVYTSEDLNDLGRDLTISPTLQCSVRGSRSKDVEKKAGYMTVVPFARKVG
jgi:hypothetical protein